MKIRRNVLDTFTNCQVLFQQEFKFPYFNLFLDLEDARWNFHKVAREGFYLRLDGEIRFTTSIVKSCDRCISLALSTGEKVCVPKDLQEEIRMYPDGAKNLRTCMRNIMAPKSLTQPIICETASKLFRERNRWTMGRIQTLITGRKAQGTYATQRSAQEIIASSRKILRTSWSDHQNQVPVCVRLIIFTKLRKFSNGKSSNERCVSRPTLWNITKRTVDLCMSARQTR